MNTSATKLRRRSQNTDTFQSDMLASRLMGMETEYASLVHDQLTDLDRMLPSAKSVYRSIVSAMRQSRPSAIGLHDGDQVFFSNGSSVTFEAHPLLQDVPGGLVEMATPEVRSPSDLLASQRVVDDMVRDAASKCDVAADLRILKNNADGLGHVYGCQENYEADVAEGAWLWVYRLCIAALWMTQIAAAIAASPLIALLLFATVIQIWTLRRRGNDDPSTTQAYLAIPRLIRSPCMGLIQATHYPIAWGLRFVGRHVAFRRQRQYLTTLLITRITYGGAGELDAKGRFYLSAKASVINRLADIGGFSGERPVFVYGHWFSQLCGKSIDSWRRTLRLFRKRQRLQIGLSDSNMSEMAEYVKVGSVSLLMDMIEQGETDSLPRLRRPIAALRQISRDWHLVQRVATDRGEMSALEIQQAYLSAVQKFVDQTPANVRGEALRITSSWQSLLDALVNYRHDADDFAAAICKIDWLTKRWLIERQGAGASWSQKKKIDLRYHELSDDGYFRQLTEGAIDESLANREKRIQRAAAPPSNTPAARRGWTIREFSGGDVRLNVGWDHAEVAVGRRVRRIDFGNHVY
ncbi:proteasome accessory factor PafA2 family protein [Crateriforma conspicua]|uniref:Pup deamidase/depupylase n=1 Tax=Crateriforma conspicua TaxID=2527996 RepID=A0A5C5Y3S0_9PLAN|nr:proteasome accessory factor PafA2 family protein [Crateriforma conspicua]QDV63590.1 Pup deamidase/depupylase [Crateriforma conspicua]TWT68915.1 Pup deamidase/depupylase [Crateriforma conspicua]